MNGYDDIDFLISKRAQIDAFEKLTKHILMSEMKIAVLAGDGIGWK